MQLNSKQLKDRLGLDIAEAVETAIKGSPPSHRASDREKITRMVRSAFGLDAVDNSGDGASTRKESGKFS